MTEFCNPKCKGKPFLRIIAVAATLALVYSAFYNFRANHGTGTMPHSSGKMAVKSQTRPQTSYLPMTRQDETTKLISNKTIKAITPVNATADKSPTSMLSNPQWFNNSCDDVCRQFKERLSNWPKDKPKAAMSYPLRNNKLIGRSLQRLYNNFLKNFPYPVVIFHEINFNRSALRKTCKQCEIYFQLVTLEAPPFLNFSIPKITPCSRHSVGYRHMCRFQAKTVYELTMFQGLRYVWRLDDDSNILSPIKYDVFKFMETHQYRYGHIGIAMESKACMTGLWGNVTNFVARDKLNSSGLKGWRRDHIFYNNFELSELSLWTSEQ